MSAPPEADAAPTEAAPGKPAAPGNPKIDPQAAAVLDHWKLAKARAGDALASVQADIERSKFYDNIQSQIADLPPDQRAPFVASQFPELRKAISDYAMSPARARQEAARQSQWEVHASNNIATQGFKEYFQNGLQLGLADADTKFQNGDVEGGMARFMDLHSSGLLGKSELADQIKNAEAKLKETKLTTYMNQGAKAFNEDINEHYRTGSHPILGGLIDSPENVAMWKARSDTQFGKLKTSEQQNLFTGIHGGTITRPDQIHAAVTGSQTLDEQDHRAAQLALQNASAPLDPVKYNNLRVAVAHYDAKADPGSGRRASLQRAIASSLPSGEGGGLSDQLKKLAEKRPPGANVDAAIKADLQRLYRIGLMGRYVIAPETMLIDAASSLANPLAQMQASHKLGKFMDGWEAHYQANPDISYADANKWIYQQLKPHIIAHASTDPVPAPHPTPRP